MNLEYWKQRAEAAETRVSVLEDYLLIERTSHNETLEREDGLKSKLEDLESFNWNGDIILRKIEGLE